MRPTRIVGSLLAFSLGLGAAGLTACGSTNKAMIPAVNAEQLKSDLDAVLTAIDGQDCSAATRAIAQVHSDLLALPAGTSQRLTQRLQEGEATLADQTTRECEATTATTPSTATTTVATTTTPTTTTPTTTTPTTTTPTTTPTTTTPTTTTPPITTPTTTTPNDTGGTGTP